jgi:serine/threonine protein phosphatase PrpC
MNGDFMIVSKYMTPGKDGGRYGGLQQDALLTARMPSATSGQARILVNQMLLAGAKATEHYLDGGSTASIAVLTPDNKITRSHVGDSPILVVVRDGVTGEVFINNLESDHSPNNPRVKQMIEQNGGVVRNGRVSDKNGGQLLAMGHAFGDKDFPGVSSDWRTLSSSSLADRMIHAGAKKHKDPNSPLNRVWLVVASDGLTEAAHNPEGESRLKDCFSRAALAPDQAKAAKNLAQDLVQAAMNNGSTDNIAVTAIEVAPVGSRLHDDNAFVLAVMDGHGKKGAEVSSALRVSFDGTIKDFISKQPVSSKSEPYRS